MDNDTPVFTCEEKNGLDEFENSPVSSATLIGFWIHEMQGPPGYALDCFRRTPKVDLSKDES